MPFGYVIPPNIRVRSVDEITKEQGLRDNSGSCTIQNAKMKVFDETWNVTEIVSRYTITFSGITWKLKRMYTAN